LVTRGTIVIAACAALGARVASRRPAQNAHNADIDAPLQTLRRHGRPTMGSPVRSTSVPAMRTPTSAAPNPVNSVDGQWPHNDRASP
jgi:hypothetical protein